MSKAQTLVAVFDGADLKTFRYDEGRLNAVTDLADHDKGGDRHSSDDESHSPNAASEESFIGGVAKILAKAAEAGRFDHLVVAADAKSLGMFRSAVTPGLKAKISHEIDRDYVNTPTSDLEAALKTRLAES